MAFVFVFAFVDRLTRAHIMHKTMTTTPHTRRQQHTLHTRAWAVATESTERYRHTRTHKHHKIVRCHTNGHTLRAPSFRLYYYILFLYFFVFGPTIAHAVCTRSNLNFIRLLRFLVLVLWVFSETQFMSVGWATWSNMHLGLWRRKQWSVRTGDDTIFEHACVQRSGNRKRWWDDFYSGKCNESDIASIWIDSAIYYDCLLHSTHFTLFLTLSYSLFLHLVRHATISSMRIECWQSTQSQCVWKK